jgi:hypothetical protein
MSTFDLSGILGSLYERCKKSLIRLKRGAENKLIQGCLHAQKKFACKIFKEK